jgi:large subunit ribosomal protein L35
MSAFTLSMSAVGAKCAGAKVGGLGFRRAVAAVRMPVQPKSAKAAPQSAFMVVAQTQAQKKGAGAKAKTRKSAAKRFKITASGKVIRR